MDCRKTICELLSVERRRGVILRFRDLPFYTHPHTTRTENTLHPWLFTRNHRPGRTLRWPRISSKARTWMDPPRTLPVVPKGADTAGRDLARIPFEMSTLPLLAAGVSGLSFLCSFRMKTPLLLRSRVESSAIRGEMRTWGCSVTSERCFYLEEERGKAADGL